MQECYDIIYLLVSLPKSAESASSAIKSRRSLLRLQAGFAGRPAYMNETHIRCMRHPEALAGSVSISRISKYNIGTVALTGGSEKEGRLQRHLELGRVQDEQFGPPLLQKKNLIVQGEPGERRYAPRPFDGHEEQTGRHLTNCFRVRGRRGWILRESDRMWELEITKKHRKIKNNHDLWDAGFEFASVLQFHN